MPTRYTISTGKMDTSSVTVLPVERTHHELVDHIPHHRWNRMCNRIHPRIFRLDPRRKMSRILRRTPMRQIRWASRLAYPQNTQRMYLVERGLICHYHTVSQSITSGMSSSHIEIAPYAMSISKSCAITVVKQDASQMTCSATLKTTTETNTG